MTSDARKKSLNREYFKGLKRLNQNFIQLLSMKEKKPSMQFKLKLDVVLILSPNELSQEEKQVRARGFQFRPTLEELPIKVEGHRFHMCEKVGNQGLLVKIDFFGKAVVIFILQYIVN